MMQDFHQQYIGNKRKGSLTQLNVIDKPAWQIHSRPLLGHFLSRATRGDPQSQYLRYPPYVMLIHLGGPLCNSTHKLQGSPVKFPPEATRLCDDLAANLCEAGLKAFPVPLKDCGTWSGSRV